jgi:hypothetical protein
MLCFFKKLYSCQHPEKKVVSVNFSHAVFSLLSTHEDWQCRPWFSSAWCGLEGPVLAWFGWVLHMQIQGELTYLSAKFKDKT